MIKGILFDKDGTLIDFYKVWGTAAGPVMDRLLAGCHMGEREFLKKELLERLGLLVFMIRRSTRKEHSRG